MHGQGHPAAVDPLQGGVVGGDILLQSLVRVNPKRPPLLPALLIDIVRVVRAIDPDVGHGLRRQDLHLVADDGGHIGQEVRPARVGLTADAGVVAARHDVRGRRQRDLDRTGRMLLEEAGLVGGQAALLAQPLADHAAHRWSDSRGRPRRPTEAAPAHHDGRWALHVSFHRFRELARPAAATVLAVREHVQAHLLLQLQRGQDRPILHLPHLFEGHAAFSVGGMRL